MKPDIFKELFEKYKALEVCRDDILRAFDILSNVYKNGGKLLLCGNGGSAADCEHIVGELMKGFKKKRPVPEAFKTALAAFGAEHLADCLQGALPAVCLTSQTALLTAFSNDINYDCVFAQQVYGYGKPGDALFAISTSGSAKSVANACLTAKAMGLFTVGLSGETGGALGKLCDVCIRVPFSDTPAVQEAHLPIYHALCAALEESFWE